MIVAWFRAAPRRDLLRPAATRRVAPQAIFVGVYIHGVACFGAEQIFYDDEQFAARLVAEVRD